MLLRKHLYMQLEGKQDSQVLARGAPTLWASAADHTELGDWEIQVELRTKEITTGYQTLTYKSHQAIQCNPASERCHLQKMICAELYLCVTEILGNYWREG